jgi:uncharacterized protein with HEPN domain
MRKADFRVYAQDILEAIQRIDEDIGEMTFIKKAFVPL